MKELGQLFCVMTLDLFWAVGAVLPLELWVTSIETGLGWGLNEGCSGSPVWKLVVSDNGQRVIYSHTVIYSGSKLAELFATSIDVRRE